MQPRTIGAALVLLLAVSASGGASFAQSLSSALVDRTMFRDGEVMRSARPFGDWVLVCDEIVRLRQRFCSLRTALVDDRQAKVILDVSTGDDGQPAALLRLPTHLAVFDGVVISAGPSRQRRLPIAVCTANECQCVWSVTKTEVAVLDSGKSIDASYRTAEVGDLPIMAVRLRPLPTARFRISGRGFHEAVEASLH